MPWRIGLVIFDDVTALDVVGPADVFANTRVDDRPVYEPLDQGAVVTAERDIPDHLRDVRADLVVAQPALALTIHPARHGASLGSGTSWQPPQQRFSRREISTETSS